MSEGGADDGEAEVADFEVALFQMLNRAFGVELGMAGQVNLAVFQHDLAGGVDQDGGVVVVPVRGAFGVAEVEGQVEAAGGIEERGGFVGGEAGLEPKVGLGTVFKIVPGEKGGERQFGKDDEFGAAGLGAFHETDHAGDGAVAALGALDGAELGGGDGQCPRHA